jgi:hypothetical protein
MKAARPHIQEFPVKKSAKLSFGTLAVAGAFGAMLIPATAASAADAPAFVCPANTDTVEVPYAYAADNTPELAGTVCVEAGGTAFETMNVTPGWSAQLKSDGSDGRTEVRFSEAVTRDRVELRYEAGRTEIK